MRVLRLLLIVSLSACSFDAGDSPVEGTPWDLEDLGNGDQTPGTDAGNNATNNSQNNPDPTNNPDPMNNPDPTNNPDPVNNPDPTNNSDPTNNQTPDAGTDMASDMSTPDMAPDMPAPDMPANSACMTNSDCSGAQVCCVDLTGSAVCQDNCLFGGLCGSDADCAGNEECCDLSDIGLQQQVCAPTCGGGNGGQGCTVTSDCPGSQVCCPGLGGQSTCQQQCLTGGSCNTAADCKNGQDCCDLRFGSDQCLNQCSF